MKFGICTEYAYVSLMCAFKFDCIYWMQSNAIYAFEKIETEYHKSINESQYLVAYRSQNLWFQFELKSIFEFQS